MSSMGRGLRQGPGLPPLASRPRPKRLFLWRSGHVMDGGAALGARPLLPARRAARAGPGRGRPRWERDAGGRRWAARPHPNPPAPTSASQLPPRPPQEAVPGRGTLRAPGSRARPARPDGAENQVAENQVSAAAVTGERRAPHARRPAQRWGLCLPVAWRRPSG